MRTIYKYPLKIERDQEIDMPESALLLTVQMQNGSLVLWAEVNTEEPVRSFSIRIYGTGHEVTRSGQTYIGTVQSGFLVWHVYNLWRSHG